MNRPQNNKLNQSHTSAQQPDVNQQFESKLLVFFNAN